MKSKKHSFNHSITNNLFSCEKEKENVLKVFSDSVDNPPSPFSNVGHSNYDRHKNNKCSKKKISPKSLTNNLSLKQKFPQNSHYKNDPFVNVLGIKSATYSTENKCQKIEAVTMAKTATKITELNAKSYAQAVKSDSSSDSDCVPRTAHIEAELRLVYNDNPQLAKRINTFYKTNHDIKAKILIDTGCAATTISTKFYNQLRHGVVGKTHDKSTLMLESCTSKQSRIKGSTTVRLWLTEQNFYDIDVMICDELSNEVILGLDFLGGSNIKMITPKHLILNKKNPVNGLYIKVPLQIKELHPLVAYNNALTVIEPFSPAFLAFDTSKCNFEHDTNSFCVTKSLMSNLKVLPTAYVTKGPNDKFFVPVYNDSMNEIVVNEGTKICDIRPIKNDTLSPQTLNINRMAFIDPSDEKPFVPVKNIIFDANQVIDDSKVLTDDEKVSCKEKLDIDGYFKPSVTDYIHEKSAITEIGLENEKPLTRDEFLKQFDLKHLSQKFQLKAKEIFEKNIKAFAMSKFDIGKTDLIKMSIPITNSNPRPQKYVPIPLHARDKVKEILDNLHRHGIIRECNEPSPYCSNILVVKKREGNDIRLLFDGRLLNYDSKRLPMSTVSKPEILAHLVNKKHLTSLDFADSFFHIQLEEKSQPLTAFYSSVHGQRFCFTRAPQGLRNSPLYLKLLLDKVFSDMSDDVIMFFDDVLIATDGTLQEHLDTVDRVLQKIVAAGLKLRPKKICLAKKHVEFLGMVFEKGKVNIPEAKLEAFKKLPSPRTPKNCKSVISALSYYRHFCPNFAELTHEIMNLSTLNGKQFKWTDDHEKKFRKLISTICTNTSLYLPDPSKKIYVQSDASLYCAGGRVFQKNEKGEEMLIAAVSRTFSKTERAYSIFKKEILSLLYCLKSLDFFLRFSDDLTILVDAKSIIYLRLAKDSSGILLRFSLELSKYNAEIFHVSGEDNIISDVLSRHNSEIDEILTEAENSKPLTDKESVALVKKLTLPDGFHLTAEEVKRLLDGPSPTQTVNKTARKSTGKSGERKIKNTPEVLVNKKLNLPKLSHKRPGVILPKKSDVDARKSEPQNDTFYQAIQINALTRSKSAQAEKEAKKAKRLELKQKKKVQFNTETRSMKQKRTLNEIDQPTADTGIASIDDSTNLSQNLESNDVPIQINISERHPTENSEIENIEIDTSQMANSQKQSQEQLASPKFTDEIENSVEINDDFDFAEHDPINDFMPPYSQLVDDQNAGNTQREYAGNTQNDLCTQTSFDNQTDNDMPDFISYRNVGTLTSVLKNGIISLSHFKRAQEEDDFCNEIKEKFDKYKNNYSIINGILFKLFKDDEKKPVLPYVLVEIIVQLKHFSIYGAHRSPTRINRDMKREFFIPNNILFNKLREIKQTCYLCQIFEHNTEGQKISALPKPDKPRVSWSIDIVPNIPMSKNGFTNLLMCVDDFSSFMVCCAMRDTSSKSIIDALRTNIFAIFGIPKSIRSDEQSSFYSSREFYAFLKTFNITLQPTAVASPFSNGRCESQIKNLKELARKFFYQESCLKQWDEYIPILAQTHNSSTGTYGYSAEELVFGFKNPQVTDILVFDTTTENPETLIEAIIARTDKVRKLFQNQQEKHQDKSRTFKNINRVHKTFEIGNLVLQKQAQVSTGQASSLKPKFTGPYVIVSINKDKCTAIIEHLHNDALSKAHFNNLQLLHFNPKRLSIKDQNVENIFSFLKQSC